ncbi:MAG: ATP-binding protein [Thermodesulfobacteriota bacterium]
MPDLFRTIRFRLTLWFTGIFSVSAAVAFILFYYLAVQTLQDQIDEDLLDKSSQFSSVIRQSGLRGAGNLAVMESKAAGEKMIFFRLLYPSGEVFASSHMSYWKDIQVDQTMLDRLMEKKSPVFDTRRMDNDHKARILYAFVARNAILQTGITMESQSRLLGAFKRVFMVAMGFIVGFSALSGWFLVQKALSRVDTITRTANSITGSSLQKRVPVTGSKDELDHLAGTFNRMLDRIESLVEGIREMGDNMAHDLKSPVTRIRGVAEMTLLQADTLEEFHTMAASTIEEADRLLDMINTMLVISRTRAGEGNFHFEPLDLTQMIQAACDLYAPVAEDKQIDFACQIPGRFEMTADVAMLQRAFSNLLDNAIKYTGPGGRILVEMIRKNDTMIEIRVTDTGPGIPEELHDRIFDRFFRAESSRSSSGSGLGLSFARAIVREHDGDIQVGSSQGNGACFILTLPYCNFQVI